MFLQISDLHLSQTYSMMFEKEVSTQCLECLPRSDKTWGGKDETCEQVKKLLKKCLVVWRVVASVSSVASNFCSKSYLDKSCWTISRIKIDSEWDTLSLRIKHVFQVHGSGSLMYLYMDIKEDDIGWSHQELITRLRPIGYMSLLGLHEWFFRMLSYARVPMQIYVFF